MRVFFNHSQLQTDGISTFWFRPEEHFRYLAGQYAELCLPHETPDTRGLKRWFTLTTSPDDSMIAITTKFPEKPSSYKQALRNLQPGAMVYLSEPLGDFVLPKDASIPLVFIAVGTGCAPYASMLKWLIGRQEKRTIRLLYAARKPGDFVFTELWRNYPMQYIPIVSQPAKDWRGETGKLTTVKVLELIGDVGSKLIYLAGPQTAVEPLYDELLTHVPRPQLLLDYFPGY
jgi:ferredoxin-NADP reductase